ncbi:MAG: DUF3887 domain-containing protein [Bacteroidota bacterium]
MRLLPLAFALLLLPVPALAQPADTAFVARAEMLVDALLAGDTETVAADFNEQMHTALPPERLATLGPTLQAQLGVRQERLGARVEPGPVTTVVVTERFERATVDVRVSFDAEGKVAGLFVRPVPPEEAAEVEPSALPPYADETAYRSEDVTVDAGVGLPLGGTLLVPESDAPVPGVVLVHGSGPSDRDGTVGPNKPLRDLAVGSASDGVAVLRFEKRTKAHPEAFAGGTYTVFDESIEDALTALDLLRGHPDVDPERLFVAGHSLGGMLAPRTARSAAERGVPVAGYVVLAGGARPLEDIVEDQLDYLDGVAPDADGQRATIRKALAAVRALAPADSASTEPILGAPPAYWLDLRAHAPATLAADLGVPVLVVHGGRDYQVPDADFAVWQDALADAPHATLRRYPSLNHLLVSGEGPSAPAEYEQPGFVDATLVGETAEWIRSQ